MGDIVSHDGHSQNEGILVLDENVRENECPCGQKYSSVGNPWMDSVIFSLTSLNLGTPVQMADSMMIALIKLLGLRYRCAIHLFVNILSFSDIGDSLVPNYTTSIQDK